MSSPLIAAGQDKREAGGQEAKGATTDASVGAGGSVATSGKDDLFMEVLKGSNRTQVASVGEDQTGCTGGACISAVPEPSAMVLVASGLVGIAALGLLKRRRRTQV